jgi:hypothetical protein
MKKRWLRGILAGLWLANFFSFNVANADSPADMINALYEYYEICQREDIQTYMEIMDFSDADKYPPNHVENTKKLAQDIWEVYDILDFELSEVEPVVDEASEFGLIKYHIRETLEGPDSSGEVAIATLEIDYVALMHHVGMWKIVYLVPEATFVQNVANLSPVSVIADMIEEDRSRIINEPPAASFSIMPEEPTTEDIVMLVSTSSDPDGDELTYSWYIDDEFVSGAGDSPDWEWVAPEPGKHKITLVVNDGRGGKDEYSATVDINGSGIGIGVIVGIAAGLVVILLILLRFRGKQKDN